MYGKSCWRARPCSPPTISIQFLFFFEIQTIIKSHSLMLGTSNFAILVFSICSFHFWHSLSYSPQYKRLLGKLWSRDPSCKGPIWGFAMVGYSVTYVWSKNISEKEGKWVWIQNKRELDIYSWVQISKVDFISKWLKTYSLSSFSLNICSFKARILSSIFLVSISSCCALLVLSCLTALILTEGNGNYSNK